MPTSQLCIIPECKHSSHLEQPAAVVALIREFCSASDRAEPHATPARTVSGSLLVTHRPVATPPGAGSKAN
jgi:hypothetical protein